MQDEKDRAKDEKRRAQDEKLPAHMRESPWGDDAKLFSEMRVQFNAERSLTGEDKKYFNRMTRPENAPIIPLLIGIGISLMDTAYVLGHLGAYIDGVRRNGVTNALDTFDTFLMKLAGFERYGSEEYARALRDFKQRGGMRSEDTAQLLACLVDWATADGPLFTVLKLEQVLLYKMNISLRSDIIEQLVWAFWKGEFRVPKSILAKRIGVRLAALALSITKPCNPPKSDEIDDIGK